MQIVYRACRLSDLAGPPQSWFGQGLTNHRPGASVNARFGDAGYTTNGLSSSTDPVVAFIYACMQIKRTPGMAVFAIAIDDATASAGDVSRQASTHNVAPASVTGKSVAAQREVVLSNVQRSAVLGHYSIRVHKQFYDLGHWDTVSGDPAVQRHAYMMLTQAVRSFAQRSGGVISDDIYTKELGRLMGH
jgi:hypothetical protein